MLTAARLRASIGAGYYNISLTHVAPPFWLHSASIMNATCHGAGGPVLHRKARSGGTCSSGSYSGRLVPCSTILCKSRRRFGVFAEPQQRDAASAAPKLLLVDGHSLAYRAYYVPYSPITMGRMQNSSGVPTAICFGFMKSLLAIMKKEQPSAVAVVFDTGKSFRSARRPFLRTNQRPSPPKDATTKACGKLLQRQKSCLFLCLNRFHLPLVPKNNGSPYSALVFVGVQE